MDWICQQVLHWYVFYILNKIINHSYELKKNLSPLTYVYPLGSGFAFHISCCHCHFKGVFNPFYEISQMFFIIEQTNPIMQSRYLGIRLKALRRLKFFLTHGVWGSSLCWNQWAMLISLCSTKNTFYT